MKTLTTQEQHDISQAAGWQVIGGFQRTSYRWTSPHGDYVANLPDYNEDKKALKEDLQLILNKVQRLNDLAALCHQALI